MSTQVGYSGTPLPRKLGIAAGRRVLLVRAPAGFDLGPLPDGVELHHEPAGDDAPGDRSEPYDVVLAFCPDLAAVRDHFAPLADRIPPNGALWICWPKRSSGVPTDLTENVVRATGLAAGLVDVKVAAVDTTWSALKFVYRLADR
jgi:hypothetical protein